MGHVAEVDGCRLAYTVAGSGPPVLMIQGVGVCGSGWRPQVDGLADAFTCLSFDNRGIGGSQPLPDGLTVTRMAEDARAVMDAAGWESAHVVGHSLGGLVAVALALEHRRRVRSLSLLCTFADGKAVAPLTFGMIWFGMRSKVGTRRMRRRGFLRLVMPKDALRRENPDALAAKLGELFGHDIAGSPPIVNKQLKAMQGSNLVPRLGELAGVPTLVLSGKHDLIAPPKLGRQLAEGIPGARYEEFADAAHGLPIQFPERTNDLLRGHFAASDGR